MMPCQEWPIAWPCPTEGIDPALLDAAHDLAGQLIWSLSGHRVGVCTYREGFRPAMTAGCAAPYKDRYGNWRNGGRQGDCCRVLLSWRPVQTILEVHDGGVLLDPSEYALEGSWLRRRGECWTASFPCDDPELIVAYQAGVPFPAGTAAAVGEVACEYLAALQGGQCRLPSRATSITRQGVTVTLDTAADFVNRRRIGLPITDAWLESVAGSGPRVASKVYSPDVAHGRSVSTGAPVPISSGSGSVPFTWRQSDPVTKTVLALDGVARGWIGVYQSQIRVAPDSDSALVGTFTVTAVAEGPDVRMEFTLTEAESAAIEPGTYYWDAQQEGGPTRLTGTAEVLAEITVMV